MVRPILSFQPWTILRAGSMRRARQNGGSDSIIIPTSCHCASNTAPPEWPWGQLDSKRKILFPSFRAKEIGFCGEIQEPAGECPRLHKALPGSSLEDAPSLLS